MILKILDIFFVVFHSSLIVFNVFGWIWKKTRKANLVVLLLTGASWFLLGIFYGIGYCPLTDWHFQVLDKLGKTGLPTSYTEYLAERITGINFRGDLVDALTMSVFLFALAISIFLNIRDFRTSRK
jgi:hypothetical protein